MLSPAQIAKVIWFYARSFFKASWTLEDYPLEVTQRAEDILGPKFKALPWTVAIVNWWHMRGDAETYEGALSDLRTKFAEFARDNSLPRPGTGAKFDVSMASTDLVQKYEQLARDIMPKVLGFEFEDCLITDESSLGDFPDPDDEYLRKLGIFYGVHPSDLPDHRLVTIFAAVAAKRGPA